MSKRIVIIGTCVLGLLLATTSSLQGADETGTKSAQAKSVAEPQAAVAWQRRVPGFESDNLPLGEIIKELRSRFPEINFIIKRQNENNYISGASITMTLRAVTLQEILKAVELAADRPLQITGAPDERLVIFEKPLIDTSGMPVDAPPATRVYNIGSYLAQRPDSEASQALKELEEVIHMAGEMLTRASSGARSFRPTLSVHPSTKLLIVVGRPDELAVVEQVVVQLQGTGSKTSTRPGIGDAKPAGPLPGGNKQ